MDETKKVEPKTSVEIGATLKAWLDNQYQDEKTKAYCEGIREGERALSHMSILRFISWRHKMRHGKEIQNRDKQIRIGQLEQRIKMDQEELEEVNKR